MNLHEDAEMSYQPDDDSSGGIEAALTEAERQLSLRQGFQGIGRTQTAAGDDAILVYVADQQALDNLPAQVKGFSVIGEITGEILRTVTPLRLPRHE